MRSGRLGLETLANSQPADDDERKTDYDAPERARVHVDQRPREKREAGELEEPCGWLCHGPIIRRMKRRSTGTAYMARCGINATAHEHRNQHGAAGLYVRLRVLPRGSEHG